MKYNNFSRILFLLNPLKFCFKIKSMIILPNYEVINFIRKYRKVVFMTIRLNKVYIRLSQIRFLA